MDVHVRRAFSFGSGGDAFPTCEWRLRRNCSLSPGQCAAAMGALAALVLGAAVLCGVCSGSWFALPFAVVCVASIAVAFLSYARHVTDGETVTLAPPVLTVTIDNGSDRSVHRMHVRGIRVSVADPGSPISVCDGHHRIQIGRYLTPGARDELASQLRRKLAACR